MRIKAVIIFLSSLCTFFAEAQEIIYSTADSYIRGGSYASTNYGNSTSLEVKSAKGFDEYTRKALLRFDLSNISNTPISSAVLMVHTADLSSSFDLTASVLGDEWFENTVNWNNIPIAGPSIKTIHLDSKGVDYLLDITSALFGELAGDSVLSLQLEDLSFADELAKFNSRESDEGQPRILLFFGGDTLPAAPELTSSRYESSGEIRLEWTDHSENETGFMIERRLNGGSFFVQDTLIYNATEWLDTGVEGGNFFEYRIRAFNPYGNSAYSLTKQVDLSANTVPSKVTDLQAEALASGRIALRWSHEGSARGFIVWKKIDEDFEIIDSLPADQFTYVDSFLAPSTLHTYVIEAFNWLGPSEPSEMLAITSQNSRNYYFDAEKGDDQNAVNTMATPWKTMDRLNEIFVGPGDSLLLRAGQLWKGQVMPQGSGIEGFPIVLSTYGDGPKAVLDGDGIAGAVVILSEQSFWHITNLEITNQATDEASRIGVLITAGKGQWQHIYLRDLHIHDIAGRYSFQLIGKNTGGIGILGENDSRFDDILIEGCEISNITRVGIFSNGNPGTRGDRPITNLVIRNNRLSYCAGDGMIIRYAYRPLIEYNVAFENHCAPEDLVDFGVAIWVRSTDEALIQYNEVSYTRGKKDGQAFDADLDAFRTVVQYNYSHDNEGGFMLVYGSSSDAIVRYNISQDDGSKGKHILDFPIWTNPRGSGIIHNNVFYMGRESEAVLIDEALSTARFYNNIVINEGHGALYIPSEGQTATFSHNSLAGYSSQEVAVNASPVDGDPGLMAPGSGGIGFETLEGYQIESTSPCISAGIPVSQMKGDYWFKQEFTDFWGTETDPGQLDVGVHQSSAPSVVDLPGAVIHGLKPYPVPFTDTFFLSLEAGKAMDVDIRLFDQLGRNAGSPVNVSLSTGLNRIFLREFGMDHLKLNPGIYILQISSGGFPMGSMLIIKE